MGAEQHRRAWFTSGAMAGHVAEIIDADVEPCLIHPTSQEVAPCFVIVRERKSRYAVSRRRPNLGKLAQTGVEALSIDPDFHLISSDKLIEWLVLVLSNLAVLGTDRMGMLFETQSVCRPAHLMFEIWRMLNWQKTNEMPPPAV
jgi:hypothetical protein